ncbi:MAG: Fe-Mn family superoxide dismutase [Candidatus Diapherotrites archaeon]|nr:Fe-Mn family superoxide dismutase [Candidatus Diapherotrites archaeon]
MAFEAKNFENLLGLKGFSDTLLKNHFTLYQGYVANVNKLLDLLDTKEPGTLEYSELQRRFAWEWNGMRLHELYFENLTKKQNQLNDGKLMKEIERIYGSFEAWEKNFAAVGSMRGIGWVVLYYDEESKELFNIWVNEHDTGHLAGCNPLLVMDVFEHAFMIDYGLKRADYIAAFFNAIDWLAVEKRMV